MMCIVVTCMTAPMYPLISWKCLLYCCVHSAEAPFPPGFPFLYTVSVEPESRDVRIRECDNLVFVLNTTGAYIEPYQVKVQCFPQSFGSGGKTISV